MKGSVWTPFDARFGRLKERMSQHQALFDQEIALQDSVILSQLHQEFEAFLTSQNAKSDYEALKQTAEQKRRAGIGILSKWYRTLISFRGTLDEYSKVDLES